MAQKFLDTTTQTVSWFTKRHAAEELVLKAPFQRNPVWSDAQKSYLIDTILHGYPIPEIYMQETSDADGNDTYVIVDGQQRLRACLEYIDNSFALSGDDMTLAQGLFFKDLSDTQRKQIYSYTFVVRKLPEMDESELRAIFGRLNRNVVALNQQELRHSTYSGKFISLVEEIADDERWAEFNIFTPNDVRRMLDVEYVSELAIAYLHGQQNKKDNLDKWYQAYELEFDRRGETRKVFNAVLSELSAIFPELLGSRWRKKSDFYTLFSVLAEANKKLPLSSNGRKKLTKALLSFGANVDEYLADPEKVKPLQAVRQYARAVERAASDLANRKERFARVKAVSKI